MNAPNRKGAGTAGVASVILAALLTTAAAAVQPPWLNRPVATDSGGEALPMVVVQDVPIDWHSAELIRMHRYATSGRPDTEKFCKKEK